MGRAESEDGNGGVKLPIGFRFHPTDEELVTHYLRRKVLSLPLPATVIPELQVFQSSPWDLPGDLKEKRYFFSRRKTMNKCSSDCGYWKPTKKSRQIFAPPPTNLVIGIKKSYVFHQWKKSRGQKNQWVMHEFCLVGSVSSTPYSTDQKIMMQVGDWVVCRVFQRKRKPARNQLENCNNSLGFPVAPTLSSPSSCCSGITEISCNDLDQEAISPQF